ncbi:MAG: hypothetical protein ACJ8R9_19870 [Steroidobacteraceae bacterium]
MNEPVSLRRRLALSLLRSVHQLLPISSLDWAKAMRAELDHLEDDREALRWAIGCVVAGSKERISTMFAANLKISRWILVPEMLLCFVPLTLGWLDALVGGSGIVRLNGDIIEKYFLRAPGGIFALVTMIAGAALGVLGPLGLASAFHLVATGRPPSRRWFRTALVTGPALYGALTLVTRLAIGGKSALSFDALDSFDFWSGILFLSALPSLGAAHMLHLAPPRPNESLAAS